MSSKTKTIKVSVQATVSKYGRGVATARAAGLEVSGKTEAEAGASLAERISVALADRVPDVLRVALAGTDVHVLVQRLGGVEMRAFDVTRGATSYGSLVSMQFDPADPAPVAAHLAFDRTSAALVAARRGSSALAIAADDPAALLRVLAGAAEVDDAGEHVDVAQRVALQIGRFRRRAEDAERRASVLEAATPAADGASPEVAAFARLFGLRADDPSLRPRAMAVLEESAGERWAHTLRDLHDGPRGLLAAIDEAAATPPEPEVDEYEHKYATWKAVEEDVVDQTWDAKGPIDQEIAERIEADELGGLAGKALTARIDADVKAAMENVVVDA